MNILSTDTEVLKPKTDKSTYVHKKLANNLELIIISNPQFPKTAISLGVEVGSFHDPLDCEGAAHFVEHMVWLGTETFPEENYIATVQAKYNGVDNAYTDNMLTVYYSEFDNGALDKIAPQFIHMLVDPLFKSSVVERELKAVNAEFVSKRDCDETRREEIFHSYLTDKRISKFKWGNNESLNHSDLHLRAKAYFDQYYSSDITCCVVLTDESPSSAFDTVTPYLAKIPNKNLKNKLHKYDPALFDSSMRHKLVTMEPVSDTNTLVLNWVIPNYERKDCFSNPLTLMTTLFESTDDNSLLKKLTEEDLVFSIKADYFDITLEECFFYVEIELTEAGLAKWKEVLERTFKMIRFYLNTAFSREFFEEKKQLAQLSFDYAEITSIAETAESLQEDFFNFGVKHLLTGKKLYGEFREDLVKEALGCLCNCNCFVPFLITKHHEMKEIIEQKHFGTKYEITEMDEDLLKIINSKEISTEVNFPSKNVLIPAELALREVLVENKNPVQLLDTPYSKVFYKQDFRFDLPKVKIGAIVNTNSKEFTLEDWAKTRLIALLFKEHKNDLDNHMYEANVTYEVNFRASFLEITLFGLTDAVKKGLTLLGESISNFSLSSFPQVKVEKYLESLTKSVNTDLTNASVSVAQWNCNEVLHTREFTLKQKQAFLRDFKVTVEELYSFWKSKMSKTSFYWLCQGNLSERETIKCSFAFEELFSRNVLPFEDVKLNERIRLEKDCFIEREVEEESNRNNGVYVAYEFGKRNVAVSTMGDLISTYVDDKFYDELRTQQQIGYTALSDFVSKCGIKVFCFKVESCDFSSFYVLGQIEKFILKHLAKLQEMDEEDFEDLKDTVNTFYLEEFENVAEEFDSNWTLVTRPTFDFGIIEEKIEFLKGITKEKLVEFYEEKLIKKRKRAVSLVNAKEEDKQREAYLKGQVEEIVLIKDDNQFK